MAEIVNGGPLGPFTVRVPADPFGNDSDDEHGSNWPAQAPASGAADESAPVAKPQTLKIGTLAQQTPFAARQLQAQPTAAAAAAAFTAAAAAAANTAGRRQEASAQEDEGGDEQYAHEQGTDEDQHTAAAGEQGDEEEYSESAVDEDPGDDDYEPDADEMNEPDDEEFDEKDPEESRVLVHPPPPPPNVFSSFAKSGAQATSKAVATPPGPPKSAFLAAAAAAASTESIVKPDDSHSELPARLRNRLGSRITSVPAPPAIEVPAHVQASQPVQDHLPTAAKSAFLQAANKGPGVFTAFAKIAAPQSAAEASSSVSNGFAFKKAPLTEGPAPTLGGFLKKAAADTAPTPAAPSQPLAKPGPPFSKSFADIVSKPLLAPTSSTAPPVSKPPPGSAFGAAVAASSTAPKPFATPNATTTSSQVSQPPLSAFPALRGTASVDGKSGQAAGSFGGPKAGGPVFGVAKPPTFASAQSSTAAAVAPSAFVAKAPSFGTASSFSKLPSTTPAAAAGPKLVAIAPAKFGSTLTSTAPAAGSVFAPSQPLPAPSTPLSSETKSSATATVSVLDTQSTSRVSGFSQAPLSAFSAQPPTAGFFASKTYSTPSLPPSASSALKPLSQGDLEQQNQARQEQRKEEQEREQQLGARIDAAVAAACTKATIAVVDMEYESAISSTATVIAQEHENLIACAAQRAEDSLCVEMVDHAVQVAIAEQEHLHHNVEEACLDRMLDEFVAVLAADMAHAWQMLRAWHSWAQKIAVVKAVRPAQMLGLESRKEQLQRLTGQAISMPTTVRTQPPQPTQPSVALATKRIEVLREISSLADMRHTQQRPWHMKLAIVATQLHDFVPSVLYHFGYDFAAPLPTSASQLLSNDWASGPDGRHVMHSVVVAAIGPDAVAAPQMTNPPLPLPGAEHSMSSQHHLASSTSLLLLVDPSDSPKALKHLLSLLSATLGPSLPVQLVVAFPGPNEPPASLMRVLASSPFLRKVTQWLCQPLLWPSTPSAAAAPVTVPDGRTAETLRDVLTGSLRWLAAHIEDPADFVPVGVYVSDLLDTLVVLPLLRDAAVEGLTPSGLVAVYNASVDDWAAKVIVTPYVCMYVCMHVYVRVWCVCVCVCVCVCLCVCVHVCLREQRF
jgi:hypothetical protein